MTRQDISERVGKILVEHLGCEHQLVPNEGTNLVDRCAGGDAMNAADRFHLRWTIPTIVLPIAIAGCTKDEFVTRFNGWVTLIVLVGIVVVVIGALLWPGPEPHDCPHQDADGEGSMLGRRTDDGA